MNTPLDELLAEFPALGDFPAMRHTVPLGIAFPPKLGFSKCEIAPGLEIRECTETDTQLLKTVNETYSSQITRMHTVPKLHISHVICIDEQIYGRHVEHKIMSELGRHTDLRFKKLIIDDIFKMVVTSLNLFQLFPLYATPYFITEELDKNVVSPSLFQRVKVVWWSWLDRYAIPTGYDLTSGGTITSDNIIQVVNILEKYYRYDGWKANRIAVSLHNFWNALYIDESTLSFLALVTILETFTNLDKEENVEAQIYRNIPKLVPLDAHARPVTKKRLEAIYETRSTIAHGSYGADGRGNITFGVTHLDAKFANVDVRLSGEVMSIAVKMLHRVIFDSNLMSVIENARTRKQERRALRRYVDSLPGAEISGPVS